MNEQVLRKENQAFEFVNFIVKKKATRSSINLLNVLILIVTTNDVKI